MLVYSSDYDKGDADLFELCKFCKSERALAFLKGCSVNRPCPNIIRALFLCRSRLRDSARRDTEYLVLADQCPRGVDIKIGLPKVQPVGSHGKSHRKLVDLDDRALREELLESRLRIEDIIGRGVDSISYPHGYANRRVKEIALETGYRAGAGSRFGINVVNEDMMFLKRTEVWATDSDGDFHRKYRGGWDWYGMYQRFLGM